MNKETKTPKMSETLRTDVWVGQPVTCVLDPGAIPTTPHFWTGASTTYGPAEVPNPPKFTLSPEQLEHITKAAEKFETQAYKFLEEASEQLKIKASMRDVNGVGERSMKSTVEAFNALTGHKLTEEEGWEFMVLLKLVRGRQGSFRKDDYVDAAAYCALLGEAAAKKG